jgi:hypothetical protein
MQAHDTDNTRDPVLAGRLDALRAEMEKLDAPRGVKKELMAEFAKRHRPRRWTDKLTRAQWRIAGGLGSAAAALLALTVVLHAPVRLDHAGPALVGRDDSGIPFIALDSLERIEQEPAPRMVEATLPRSALATLGVPVTPENAGDPVHAEMLVSLDGRPLALRLVSQ